jgi:adenylate cyclase
MKSSPIEKQEQLVNAIMEEIRRLQPEHEDDLKDRISQLVGEYHEHNLTSQAREVTILLSDIRGFTAMSERFEANQVVSMLNHYFSEMNEIILKYGGSIDKYMGDAVLVLFGVHEQHEDDARRAISCAVEMQNAMDKVNQENQAQGLPELFVGIGINTAVVSAGQVGSDLYNEYTVIGDGVNLASRIESHSLRGQVLIGENTYSKVKDDVEIGTVNEVSVKGKSETIKLYEVIAIHWQNNMMVPRREIRTSVRVRIDASFSFQVIDGKEILSGVHAGQAKDMSYNGLFAIMQEPFEVLTDIKLMLTLSLLGGKPCDIYGKIVSIRKVEGGFGCGIEFTFVDEESRRSIKHFIDHLIEGS